MAWQKSVGGRIKSDLRFSNTLTWNNFPLPPVSNAHKQAIIAGGKAVLEARSLHPERSLADHYNPLTMDSTLLKAHRALDKAVDAVFGLKGDVDDDARLTALFAAYSKLTTAGTLRIPMTKGKNARGRKKPASPTGSTNMAPAPVNVTDEINSSPRVKNPSEISPKPADVRAWALANGYKVGDRGRIPAHVITAYLATRKRPSQE
jgi:hypothetical protein